MPGCGYPLIGRRFFTGLEHPAAFNEITAPGIYRLRQHPVWQNNTLKCASAILGWAENPKLAFQKYLQKTRLPRLKKPLFSFCTFWSDPYVGNGEYQVNTDAHLSYARAFINLGIKPDVITLDAGWQNRQSILEPKPEADLNCIQQELQKLGIRLSLWTTHNGPIGIDPEYLKEAGFSVGGGAGALYSGNNFAVLLDEKLEEVLKQRLCSLAGKEARAIHFKIDWDNECATAPEYQERYPTRNHVREATLDAVVPPTPPWFPTPAKTGMESLNMCDWFTEARFGMFIHYGLYSIPAGIWHGEIMPGSWYAEWIQTRSSVSLNSYRELAARFNPEDFNAETWVEEAALAGMKYLLITAKHHDGFALWPSKVSP